MNITSAALWLNQSDEEFNAIYPRKIRRIADRHFTPVAVAKVASRYLAPKPGVKVLDIGSGAGKFCMIGAVHTGGYFEGIEQRLTLVTLANKLSQDLGIRNVSFVNANITTIDFSHFGAFYIYNSFYENVDVHTRIDETVLLNLPLYRSYSSYTSNQLATAIPGARLATYYTPRAFVPEQFTLVRSDFDGHLDLWEKTS